MISTLKNIAALIEGGGEITLGQLDAIGECVATATDDAQCLCILVRRRGESLDALLSSCAGSTLPFSTHTKTITSPTRSTHPLHPARVRHDVELGKTCSPDAYARANAAPLRLDRQTVEQQTQAAPGLQDTVRSTRSVLAVLHFKVDFKPHVSTAVLARAWRARCACELGRRTTCRGDLACC